MNKFFNERPCARDVAWGFHIEDEVAHRDFAVAVGNFEDRVEQLGCNIFRALKKERSPRLFILVHAV